MGETITVLLELDVEDVEAALRRLVHLVEDMQPEYGTNVQREFLVEQWGWRYGQMEDATHLAVHSPPPVLRLGPAKDVIIDVLDYDVRTGQWKLLLGDGAIVTCNLASNPELYGPLMTWRKQKQARHLQELYDIWFEQGYNEMAKGKQRDPKAVLNDTSDLTGDECAAVYNGYRNGQADWKAEHPKVSKEMDYKAMHALQQAKLKDVVR
jgi:hypothetical protein